MADGTVTIDLDLNTGSIASDVDTVKDIFKSFGADVDTATIEQKFNDAFNRVENKADATIDAINDKSVSVKVDANDTALKEKVTQAVDLLSKLPEEKRTQLIAQLHEQGFNSFRELLEYIPKEKHTELLADIQEGNINKFNSLINHVKKEKITELKAKGDSEGVKSFDSKLDAIPKEKTTQLKVKDEVSTPIKHISEREEEATTKTHTLKDVMMGTFAGGLIQSGVNAITNGIKEMTRAGEEYNVQQDTMKINWENLTREAPQDGKNMVNMINDFAQHSIYSSEALDKMAQSFYHVHSNAQETKQWTQDFVNLGSTLHVSNDALAEAAEQFAKIEAGGKANAMDMQMMINRFPMFGEALEKVTGKSMQQLYQLSAKGKLTSQVFSQALDYLGNKYQKSQAEAMTSFQGMSMHLKSQFSVLSGDVMQSSFKMSKSTLAAIQSITDDKSMQTYANAISSAFGTVMSGVSKLIIYINAHKNNIMGIIKGIASIASAFGSAIWGTIKGIITGIADAFNKLSGNAKKSSEPLKSVSTALGDLAKHKTAVKELATTLLGLFAAKKVLDFAKGISKTVKSFREMTSVLGAFSNPITLTIAAIAGLTVAFVGLYKNNPKFKKFVDDLVKNMQAFGKSVAKYFKGPLEAIGKVIDKLLAPVQKAFSKMLKTITPTLKKIGSTITDTFKNVSKNVDNAHQAISKTVSTVWNHIKGIVIPIMNAIGVTIRSGLKIISTIWSSTWNLIADLFKLVWDIIFNKSKVIDDIKNLLHDALKTIQRVWSSIWNAIKDVFSSIWDGIKSIGKSAIEWIRDIIDNTTKTIQNIWNTIWNAISSFFGGIWDGLKRVASDAINWIHDTIGGVLDKINTTWTSMWNSLSSFFSGIWDNIKKYAQDGINGVLTVINAGIDGIDAVWKFFTGHETSIHHLKPVHFEQGGIVERRLSMVNDGAGPDWKELIETPDGQLMMSNERNAVLPLEPGTRVYNGAETKAIMNMMGVEHYANGGVVGDVIDWGAHKLSDFGSWIKDKWDAVTKFLKHPIENTKAIISKAIDGPIAKLENSNMVDLARGVFDKLTKPISDWFKKGLQKAKDEHDAESSGGFGKAPDLKNGAELRDVIKNALQANGLPTSDDYINAWLRQVATESGGNAHAVQPGADPDGDGSGPAIGLLQTKRATFAANAFPGHGDIFNAYDNALAAIHYAKGRYGSDMLAVIGHGHGYYKGGHVLKPEYALIGERGDEFVINPRETSADDLLMQAAQERLAYNSNSVVANAIASIKNAQLMNGRVAPTISYANNSAINAVNNNQNNINDKDVNVSFVIDGRTVAQKTFPFIKMMQSNDITLQSRKGAY